MSDPNEYESATESEWCTSPEVPGKPATQASLELQICTQCGQLVLFLVLEGEDGVRLVHSFGPEVALVWSHVFADAAIEMSDNLGALGLGFNYN